MRINTINSVKLIPHLLDFKFEAGTSRGVMNEHQVWYLILESDGKRGVGEIASLPKLSIDYGVDFSSIIAKIPFGLFDFESVTEVYAQVRKLDLQHCPSLVFALETALLDLLHGGKRKIFDSDFFNDEFEIPINGLIWMNNPAEMMYQVKRKIIDGFKCIKLKIGANWQQELALLKDIRQEYPEDDLMLRVDANGAFGFEEALDVLEELSKLQIHSIEQPMAKGNHAAMKTLCKVAKIGIALDEELIGVHTNEDKIKLLDLIEPHFLILKPTLLGGFAACDEWIALAREREIDFWITSALESNIGLNAICQYTEYHDIEGFQGLGTGQLYHNNIESPLIIDSGHIYYDQSLSWQGL